MRFHRQALAVALGMFMAAVTLKFCCEHWAAPATSGVQGALRSARSEVLLVGSSHTRQSYDVAAMERRAGCSAYVVAYNGMDYLAMLPVVREFLDDPGLRPRVLLLEAYCLTLAPTGGMPDTRLFFDAPPRLKMKLLPRYTMDGDARQRFANLFDLLVNRNNELILMFPVQALAINRLSYRGGYVGKTVAGLDHFGDMRIETATDVPDQRELDALGAIIALAGKNGVRLISIESPMPKPVEDQALVQKLKIALRRYLEAAHVDYIDGASGFPTDEPKYFADFNHLSTEGRALFTQRVAGIIREAVSAAPKPPQ